MPPQLLVFLRVAIELMAQFSFVIHEVNADPSFLAFGIEGCCLRERCTREQPS